MLDSLLGLKQALRLINGFIDDLISLNQRLLRATQRTRAPTLIARVTFSLTRSDKYHGHHRLRSTLKIGTISDLRRTRVTGLRRVVRQLTTILGFINGGPCRIRIKRSRLLTYIQIANLFVTAGRLTNFLLIPDNLATPKAFNRVECPP